jgi:hypothetical protein
MGESQIAEPKKRAPFFRITPKERPNIHLLDEAATQVPTRVPIE